MVGGESSPQQASSRAAMSVARIALPIRRAPNSRWFSPEMHEIAERYRQEDGRSLIEIALTRIGQLFNSFDPSPFHEKDLDDDAEAYIVGAVREFPVGEALKLVFYLPPEQRAPDEAPDLERAIHNYFSYRRQVAARELRFHLREGRLSLAIGLAFLALCIALRQLFFAGGEGTFEQVMAESLIIVGWVALWRPVNMFLYEWWPLRRMTLVYAKLAAMPVQLRYGKAPQEALAVAEQPS